MTDRIADWEVSYIGSDGSYSGPLSGDVKNVKTTISTGTDLGNADLASAFVELDGSAGGVISVYDWTPSVGKQYVIWCSDKTAAVLSLTLSAGITFDGTNDVATFGDADDTLVVYCVSPTRVVIVENIGSVVLS